MSTLLKLPCRFILTDTSGNKVAEGDAEVELEPERMIILPNLGQSIYLSLIDILKITAADYRLSILLSSNERLVIYDLGYKFDDLQSQVTRSRNAMIVNYMLMDEAIKRTGISGHLVLTRADDGKHTFESCELGIYETCVIFTPSDGEPIKLRFNSITKLEAQDYSISIQSESGDQFDFSQLGSELDSTVRDMSSAMNALSVRTQALIKELMPLAVPNVTREAARLLADGRATLQSKLDGISPEIWAGLEKMFEKGGGWDSYQYLKSIAGKDKMAGGIKRGLLGDLTGSYVWILAPIFSGNAIAMEAARTFGDRHDASGDNEDASVVGATYFFRLVGRPQFTGLSNSDLEASFDRLISKISDMMLDLNFRREPIYLSSENLGEPKYARYRYAAGRIPAVKDLRELYIGRVIHTSNEQWKEDVMSLLSFNTSSTDDREKWKGR